MKDSKIIVIGDIHHRYKSPFYESIIKFMEWFIESEYNDKENILILLGDLTEFSINQGKVNRDILAFLKDIRCERKIIVAGNHDESVSNGSNLEMLKNQTGVELIFKMTSLDFNDIKCLFLPHVNSTVYGMPMEDYYSNRDYVNGNYDFAFGHIQDETMTFSKNQKVCNLSGVDIGTKIFGHIHDFNIENGGNYLGSVSPNSYAERNKDARFAVIDLNTKEVEYIKVPVFLNYYTVNYPDSLPKIKEPYFLLTVKNSIDRKTTVDYYTKEALKQGKELYIRRIERIRVLKDSSEEGATEVSELSNSEYFELFTKKTKLSNSIQEKMLKCL